MDKFNIPKMPDIKIQNFPMPKIPEFKDQNLANEFHRRLMDYIITFEKSLTEYEEVALRLVTFGESITIVVETIGYWNPSLISFVGTDTKGQRVQLIQHVSQLSFLLIAIKVPEPVEPRRRIGFRQQHETENE
jgi:hypothetical protein